ncbi:MAG: universal stress protein [Candidatus Hydrothermarchaeaceae archaeon]
MYKKILIPTDGSEIAEVAVKHGIGLAKDTGSKVYGLYVVDTSAFVGVPTEAIWENMKALLEEEGKKALGKVEKMAKNAKIENEVILNEGSPYKNIIKMAEEKNIDLIVMGTAGRVGLDRFLLGSVAEKAVRTAPCPVLVVHG